MTRRKLPFKFRGSRVVASTLAAGPGRTKNPPQLSWADIRRRFSCICNAPAIWKIKSALGDI
jgi:hypothetical protein